MQACNCAILRPSCPALALAERFVQRWDLYARQLYDGRYVCVREPLRVDHVFAHLLGEITLGTYLLSQKSQARFVVIDADDKQGLAYLSSLAGVLAGEDVPAYFEKSRRGGHLWLFLARAVPGREARAFGHGLMIAHQVDGVEIFPKQDKLTGGPGSLIRMPFGVHRLTGRRYDFFTSNGKPLAQTIMDQIHALNFPQTVPEAAFEAYRSYAPSRPNKAVQKPVNRSSDLLSEQIKASITVMDFIDRYVDLKPTGSGAIGLCPFHDDHQPSLGVNNQDNYWHCFAGCGGGSVIDFWVKWRGCDFTTAITELAHVLL